MTILLFISGVQDISYWQIQKTSILLTGHPTEQIQMGSFRVRH